MSEAFTDPLMSYAQKMLARLRKDRENFAAGDGRTVRRVKACPEMLERSPYEVILEYAAGETNWDDTFAELSEWPFTFAEDAEPNNPLSVRTIGSWDDVTMARHRGLIAESEFLKLYFWICEPQEDNDTYNKEAQ